MKTSLIQSPFSNERCHFTSTTIYLYDSSSHNENETLNPSIWCVLRPHERLITMVRLN